ncbi:MAG: hypothetical protein ACOYL6_06185 [Bacteriovoracaceae bacterium]
MRALSTLLILFLFSSCAFFDQSNAANGNKKNQHEKKSDKKDDDVICRSRCENSFAQVFEYNPQNDKCLIKFAYPCFPASCDQGKVTCKIDCSSDKDCAVGAVCNSVERRCVPQGQYTCQDNYTKVDSAGSQGSCVPYRCNLGQCMNSCISGSDCAKGFICDKNLCQIQ